MLAASQTDDVGQCKTLTMHDTTNTLATQRFSSVRLYARNRIGIATMQLRIPELAVETTYMASAEADMASEYLSHCGPLGELTYTQALELMPLPGGHTTCRS